MIPRPIWGLLLVLGAASAAIAEPAGPEGPVVTFMGHRYAIGRGAEAFESIAFDPLNHELASQGKIRDLCGAEISDGPNESPGLAWDPVSNLYWQITQDRVVRRWNRDALVDTVFTIPEIFNVPGSGPDTLESVRGLAVDLTHVYVVDAGPDSGELWSNAWFKFTRSGTPVKSSKSTDLVQNLDADPDALVDDIVWVPPTSPVAPGLFLVPLEHSGIQVIDAEGNFVAKFRWRTQSLPSLVVPAAFTGLTIDPETGNLFLVNNDGGGSTQHWTRLPDGGLTSYVVGVGGSQAWLQHPNPGCNPPLLAPLPPPGQTEPFLLFGIAYRPVVNEVYGLDFGSGELYRFDPRFGRATYVASTGVFNVWGCAYDESRDVLYGAQEVSNPTFGTRIHRFHPMTGATTPLPNDVGFHMTDIGYNPVDQHIYGVSSAQLIRIDRDTGVGTLVAPTVYVTGIDYDPVSGRLIGMRSDSPNLWAIDPATGDYEIIGEAPRSNFGSSIGWEGLAVIPAGSSLTAVSPVARTTSLAVRVSPNPAAASTVASFALPHPTATEVAVYDLSGRLVRRLHSDPLPAGPQQITWDGRDGRGRHVAGGVYLLRVTAGGEAATGRVVIMR